MTHTEDREVLAELLADAQREFMETATIPHYIHHLADSLVAAGWKSPDSVRLAEAKAWEQGWQSRHRVNLTREPNPHAETK